MLTLFFASATYLQSWRIKKVCSKISEQISQNTSIAFYALTPDKESYDALTASSELCFNRRVARISQILWINGKYRGCTLNPIQFLSISPWISFPKTPCWIPFACGTSQINFKNKKDCVYLLLEAEIQPQIGSASLLRIEDYGTPIAWKIDSNLAVILATDINYLTRFLLASFLKNEYCINDQLPLIRIESITYNGKPQPYDLLVKLRKASRSKEQLNEDEWIKHLEDLHSLSVLAQQAIAYESDKQRLERSPAGTVKPDLIPANKKDNMNENKHKKETTKSIPVQIELNNDTKSEKIALPKLTKQQALPSPTIVTTKTPMSTTTDQPNFKKTLEEIRITSVDSKQQEPTASTTTAKSIDFQQYRDKQTKNLSKSNSSLNNAKPLNILVYSDIASVKQSALETLKQILPKNVYTIYALTQQELEQKYWLENTGLIVVCGAILSNVGEIIVDYFLRGGKVLSLCSDLLHFVLPTYRTAEVREHELVNFSYANWKKVKMMHHIFCYQASPVKKNFSTDSEESTHTHATKSGLVYPRSLELKDLDGGLHGVRVDVLGTEETWNTPSLLIAKSMPGGRAVFSQVHLEMQPSQFEYDESKYAILKKNDRIRLDILADLLSKQLEIVTASTKDDYLYRNAYFLGRHESKFELLQNLTRKYGGSTVRNSKLALQFSGKGDAIATASRDTLPILMHSCPEDFSTVKYFENLKTNYVGRLVIYAPIITSSMHVINELELANGIIVLVRQQTDGLGRSNNQWLSPLGCTMFSLQLHINLDSNLGRRLPIIQHVVAAAMVNAIKSHEVYKPLDIGLKWPNDIYANGNQKIGGLVVKTFQVDGKMLVNIGCGFNLDNKKPTTCLNDLIADYNKENRTFLAPIKYEEFIALILNQIESLIERIQSEDFEFFYKLYYDIWLHSGQSIHIQDSAGKERAAKVIGIDDFGFLKVQLSTGSIESVQPDGNSFDMLKGLILPKQH